MRANCVKAVFVFAQSAKAVCVCVRTVLKLRLCANCVNAVKSECVREGRTRREGDCEIRGKWKQFARH